MSVITFTCHPPAPATPLPSRPQPQANAKTSLLAVTISLILGFPPSKTLFLSLYLPWLVGRDHEGALDRQDVLHCTARRRPDASCLRITRNALIFGFICLQWLHFHQSALGWLFATEGLEKIFHVFSRNSWLLMMVLTFDGTFT